MPAYYLTYSNPKSAPDQSVFYSCDSERIAKRLASLLEKAHPGLNDFFSVKSPKDEDEDMEILWSEACEQIEVLSRCDGDFEVFDYRVTDEQKKLVNLFWKCKQWEKSISEQEKEKSEDSRSCSGFDSGPSAKQISTELVRLVSKLRAVSHQTPTSAKTTDTDTAKQIKQEAQRAWFAELSELSDEVMSHCDDLLNAVPAGIGTAMRELVKRHATPHGREHNPLDDELLATVLDEALAITQLISAGSANAPTSTQPPAPDVKPEADEEPDAGEKAKASHSADFTFVNWYGTEYTFALGVQSSAVKALWDEWEQTGLGLHQDTIRNAVDAERDNFRVDKVFRNHPAFGTMILNIGDGRYKLAPPTTGKAAPAAKVKKFARIPAKAPQKPR